MNETRPVLVIGGSRGTGLLAAQILRRDGFRVRVLARDPARPPNALGASVEVVAGDVTRRDSLDAAVKDAAAIIHTAGVRSGRFAREQEIKATDYEGVVNTLAAARHAGLAGRFVYMTSIGGLTPSFSATVLNLVKGNVLEWRRRAEEEIRASGLDYTIVRAGFLVNGDPGRRAIHVSQGDLPLAPRYRIARADVAEVCVKALTHPRASRATLEVAWGRGPRQPLEMLFDALRADR